MYSPPPPDSVLGILFLNIDNKANKRIFSFGKGVDRVAQSSLKVKSVLDVR